MKKFILSLIVSSSFLVGAQRHSFLEEMLITSSHITVELSTISTIQNYNEPPRHHPKGKYKRRYYSSLKFIEKNSCKLSFDIAKGSGEYLDSVTHILKVKSKGVYKKELQSNFTTIYNKNCKEIDTEFVNDKIFDLAMRYQ